MQKNVKYIEGPITRTTYGDVPGGKDLMINNGTHVPLVIDWPKHSKGYAKIGNSSEDLIDFSDFFATVIELAGGKVPQDREIDGQSFANRLQGKGANDRKYIFCHYWDFGRRADKAREAIHDGKWKLYNDGRFYNINKDPEEEKPLSVDKAKASKAAKKARRRLLMAYKDMRGISIPNRAPSKMFQQD